MSEHLSVPTAPRSGARRSLKRLGVLAVCFSAPLSTTVHADWTTPVADLVEARARTARVTAQWTEAAQTAAIAAATEAAPAVATPVAEAAVAPATEAAAAVAEPAAAAVAEPVVEAVAEPVVDVRADYVKLCPATLPENLLRNGAAAIGAQELCRRSIEGAATDHAAAAVVTGFWMLGTPYSRSRRDHADRVDCSSFIGRSFRKSGHPLIDADFEPNSWAMREMYATTDSPAPGDILWRPGHVAMALSDGYMMHAARSGDVAHVTTISRFRSTLRVH